MICFSFPSSTVEALVQALEQYVWRPEEHARDPYPSLPFGIPTDAETVSQWEIVMGHRNIDPMLKVALAHRAMGFQRDDFWVTRPLLTVEEQYDLLTAIRRAWRKLSLALHPDKNPLSADQPHVFQCMLNMRDLLLEYLDRKLARCVSSTHANLPSSKIHPSVHFSSDSDIIPDYVRLHFNMCKKASSCD